MCVSGAEQLVRTMTGDLVTSPGTAPTWRPSWRASDATRSAPDRAPASTTTVAADMAPSSRERARNRCLVGTAPGAFFIWGCDLR